MTDEENVTEKLILIFIGIECKSEEKKSLTSDEIKNSIKQKMNYEITKKDLKSLKKKKLIDEKDDSFTLSDKGKCVTKELLDDIKEKHTNANWDIIKEFLEQNKWTNEFQKLPDHIQDGITSLSKNIKKKKSESQLTKEFIEILNTDKKVRKIIDNKFKYQTTIAILSNRYTPKPTSKTGVKEIILDNFNTVLHSKNSIKIRRWSPIYGDNIIKVYDGNIEPIEKLNVDDFVVFRYKKSGIEHTNTTSNIVKQLKSEGGVLNRLLIEDCINAIFLKIPEKKGHATYGVYEDEEKKLFLCRDAMPLNQKQKTVKRKLEKIINNQKINQKNLDPYLTITKFWHSYEVYPSMGLAAMSPFALLLRKNHLMVFLIWHFSNVSRLGKSTVQWIFSDYLFGNPHISGDSINSKFRFSSCMDSVGCALTVDEVDNVDWNNLSSLSKESAMSEMMDSRGTSSLGFVDFLSRAALFMNSNRFQITSETDLARYLKIEFDISRIKDRAENRNNVEELKGLLKKLDPIGWELAELELERIDYSLEKLLKNIDEHENNLKDLYEFSDPRRLTAWSIIYEGLKTWEYAAEKFGVLWLIPSYEEFSKIIKITEESTSETKTENIDDFMHWWEMWKSRNTKTDIFKSTITLGKDELWADKLMVYKGKKYRGDVVTAVILREYQQGKDFKIDNLSDIAKTISYKMKIDKERLYKVWKIGGKSKWGVFIPNNYFTFKK